MDPRNSKQHARRLFLELVDLAEAERAAALDRACGGDAALRAEVEALLGADSAAGAFLSHPTSPRVPAASSGIHKSAGVDESSAASAERAGAQIGRYKLLEQIGEGGMGTIWMAEQREPVKRRVALKIIKLGMDTKQVIARFEAERQALALMDHPHIAKVLDAGSTETGRPYFVMEYIKGIPILEYCDQEKVDTAERLLLFTNVCHAIQHAHQKGIIHRDIKPSNVLVTLHDGVPVPKVIDFGIAKATNSELTAKTLFTEHRQMVGTPAYMSPEQAEMSGLDIDTRSDVYSLGVLLYELLTGTTPFDTKALLQSGYHEMLRAIREDEPHKPSTRVSTLGDTGTRTAAQRRADVKRLSVLLRGDLDWIVMKCLEKDRTRRYETANGLAADIKRHLAGDAVVAAPPSTRYRLRKFVRRNRAQVAAAGLVAAALMLGLAGTAWQARVASDRAMAATKAEGDAKIARDAEKARADELAKVSAFQEKMLAQVDPTTAGVRLTEDVVRRFAEALKKAKVPDAEQSGLLDEFRRDWSRVNATDAATALIDATILKPAAKAIDEQFKDQPILEARLRKALADRYRWLGLYDAAVPLEKAALDIRRRVLGDDARDTVTSINDVGLLLQHQGKFADAELYIREALERCLRMGGEDHIFTFNVQNNLGLLLEAQGKLVEAEACFRDVLERKRRVLGEDHISMVVAIHNMGFVLQSQQKYVESEPYVRKALERGRRENGETHPLTLRSMNNLAILLEHTGKAPEAEELRREVLEKTRSVLGEEHLDTLVAINNMGWFLMGQGKAGEAEGLFAEGLAASRRAFAGPHPEIALFLHHHADALRQLRRRNEAMAEARQAVDLYRDHPEWTPGEAAHAASVLGTLLKDQGKFAEAEPYLRESLETSRRVNGDENMITLSAINSLGSLLGEQEKFAEAEPYFREGFERAPRIYGEQHPKTLELMNNLGNLLMEMGQLDQAEPLLREALELRRRVQGEEHPATLVSMNNLAGLFEAQGKPDLVEPLYREVLEKTRRVQGEDHENTLRALNNLGLTLMEHRKSVEAEPFLREGMEKHRRVYGDRHPYTLPLFNGLGVVLMTQSKVPEAERVLAEGLASCDLNAAPLRQVAGQLLHHHADALRGLGRFEEALPEARRSAELYRAHGDWNRIEAAHSLFIFAGILSSLGKSDEALNAHRERLTVLRTMTPPESEAIGNSITVCAIALLQRGTLETAKEAEALFRECLEIRLKTIPSKWPVHSSRSQLGGALLNIVDLDPVFTPETRAARLREAEALILDGYSALKDFSAVPTAEQRVFADRQREAFERVVRLYEVWDRVEPGKGYAKKAAEWKSK